MFSGRGRTFLFVIIFCSLRANQLECTNHLFPSLVFFFVFVQNNLLLSCFAVSKMLGTQRQVFASSSTTQESSHQSLVSSQYSEKNMPCLSSIFNYDQKICCYCLLWTWYQAILLQLCLEITSPLIMHLLPFLKYFCIDSVCCKEKLCIYLSNFVSLLLRSLPSL